MDGAKLKQYLDRNKVNKTALAKSMGMSKQNLYQLFDSKTLANDTRLKLEKYLKTKWADIDCVNIDASNLQDVAKQDVHTDQPLLQIVLNLTYVSKKNADSIDKMSDGVNKIAATNQRNTEIIAALVNAILPNSGLSAEAAASLSAQDTDEGLPVEAFLGKDGAEAIRKQMQGGTKKKTGTHGIS